MPTDSFKVKAEVNVGEILTGHTCGVVTDRQLLVGKALSFRSSVVMLGRYRFRRVKTYLSVSLPSVNNFRKSKALIFILLSQSESISGVLFISAATISVAKAWISKVVL